MATEWVIDTLKEYLEAELKTLRDRCADDRIAWAREFAARDKALDLKADEYSKHFEALNGEGERIKTILGSSVSKDSFEGKMKDLDDWKRLRESNESKFLIADVFNTYKATTQETLTADRTRREGGVESKAASQLTMSQLIGIVGAAAAVAAAAAAIVALLIVHAPTLNAPVASVPPQQPIIIKK